MNKGIPLNETWIKASILGTIWAASEIVFGSFLHNLKVPFSGNILTAIGIIILISASYVWNENGLFWRAGLICAIMKTMSPSAVIFGPMIAIFSEALLLEFSVRILGKTIAGFILGAILAMSWNLFQKIANFILFYGYNIVELYSNLVKYAQKQLNSQMDLLWIPILILLGGYILLGLVSAIIGIKSGHKLLNQPPQKRPEKTENINTEKQKSIQTDFNYSIFWLIANIFIIPGSLFLLNFSTWMVWSLAITVLVMVWAIRYKRAMRQLLKPKFWIFFVIITMITSFVFTKVQASENGISDGLFIGLQMNFRAVVIILGFSALGTELYNPKIRAFFLKTSFKQLPMALEISFEMLPSMIAEIPDFKTIIKNPVSMISRVISIAELKLAELKSKTIFDQKIFIVTGAPGQGKTTQIQKIIEVLKAQNIAVGGIYSPRVIENNTTIGYDIVNVNNDEREIFLRLTGDENLNRIGRFCIYPTGLQKGKDALNNLNNSKNAFIVIDEVGNLELGNNGWASCIQELIDAHNSHIVMAVRDSFTENVIQKWSLNRNYIYAISEMDYQTISKIILDKTSSSLTDLKNQNNFIHVPQIRELV